MQPPSRTFLSWWGLSPPSGSIAARPQFWHRAWVSRSTPLVMRALKLSKPMPRPLRIIHPSRPQQQRVSPPPRRQYHPSSPSLCQRQPFLLGCLLSPRRPQGVQRPKEMSSWEPLSEVYSQLSRSFSPSSISNDGGGRQENLVMDLAQRRISFFQLSKSRHLQFCHSPSLPQTHLERSQRAISTTLHRLQQHPIRHCGNYPWQRQRRGLGLMWHSQRQTLQHLQQITPRRV